MATGEQKLEMIQLSSINKGKVIESLSQTLKRFSGQIVYSQAIIIQPHLPAYLLHHNEPHWDR